MKKIIIILCLLLCYTTEIQAQRKNKKIKVYKAWVTMIDGSKPNRINGILYFADEDFIKVKYKISGVYSVNAIDPRNIKKIKIRRKGKVGRGILIGAVTGIGVGAILGYSEKDQFFHTKESNAAAYGVTLGLLGVPIGASISSGKKRFVINGDIEKYREHLKTLQKYTIMPSN